MTRWAVVTLAVSMPMVALATTPAVDAPLLDTHPEAEAKPRVDRPRRDEPGITTASSPPSDSARVRSNALLPALESSAFLFGLLAANNLASREHFAQVSWDSTLSHFDGRRPWEFDVDYFVIN